MSSEKRSIFVSYAREDLERVRPLVDALREEIAFRALPLELWMDVSSLQPGEQWDISIANALESSVGFIFFLSPRSLKSDWVRKEVEIAATTADRLIIPVLLQDAIEVPLPFKKYQWLKFVGHPTKEETVRSAELIAEALQNRLKDIGQPQTFVTRAEAPAIAAGIARELRHSTEPSKPPGTQNSVFLVHGHDLEALAEVEKFLVSAGITPVILSRQDESPQSLFQKFMTIGGQAHFAIVLLCSDDYGASRRQYDASGVGDRALQFRSRQNVILELGFFYGRLGWESVFVVHKPAEIVFPNFERPSDLDGVVFNSLSDAGWQKKLGGKLAAAGFNLTT